jgi:hypothetical protein
MPARARPGTRLAVSQVVDLLASLRAFVWEEEAWLRRLFKENAL